MTQIFLYVILYFSDYTLQQADVQKSVFERVLSGKSEVLIGYKIGEVKITDASVIALSGKKIHPVIQHTGNRQDSVSGTLLEITENELLQADEYEVDDYQRVEVTFASGTLGFVYIAS